MLKKILMTVAVFIDIDKMVGPQFEMGLAELGRVAAEAPAAK